jgi:hypothetical protein
VASACEAEAEGVVVFHLWAAEVGEEEGLEDVEDHLDRMVDIKEENKAQIVE